MASGAGPPVADCSRAPGYPGLAYATASHGRTPRRLEHCSAAKNMQPAPTPPPSPLPPSHYPNPMLVLLSNRPSMRGSTFTHPSPCATHRHAHHTPPCRIHPCPNTSMPHDQGARRWVALSFTIAQTPEIVGCCTPAPQVPDQAPKPELRGSGTPRPHCPPCPA